MNKEADRIHLSVYMFESVSNIQCTRYIWFDRASSHQYRLDHYK